MITKTVVRENEWNEAICFKSDKHPNCEIAAQFNGKEWFVFYISSRKVNTLYYNLPMTKENACNIAEQLTWILELDSPGKWVADHYSERYGDK